MFFALQLLSIALTPAIFWYFGKRFLGEQTHPAALFILAWIALLFQFPTTMSGSQSAPLAMFWVAINFGTYALIKKLRMKPANPTGREGPNPKESPTLSP